MKLAGKKKLKKMNGEITILIPEWTSWGLILIEIKWLYYWEN